MVQPADLCSFITTMFIAYHLDTKGDDNQCKQIEQTQSQVKNASRTLQVITYAWRVYNNEG